jgi:hypothetical protein
MQRKQPSSSTNTKHNRYANTITLSMPGYEKALVRVGMSTARRVSSPAVYMMTPEYSAKITCNEVADDTPTTAAQTTCKNVLLFYARAMWTPPCSVP